MASDPTEKTDPLVAPAPWTVLVVFLLLTALVTKYVWDSSRVADRARFSSAVQSTGDAIRSRIETYVNVLRAAGGLFAANRTATRDEFRAYVQHMQVQGRYPGVQGIGLVIRIAPDNVGKIVADLRANEFADFHIWPPGSRAEYFPIVAIEPLNSRNRVSIGYDMYSSPPRSDAMNRARDTGDAAATGRVTLLREPDPKRQPGFLIYVPAYRVPMLRPTVAERRAQLYGFVYAAFRANELFDSTRGPQEPEVDFDIYDGNDFLYASQPARNASPRYSAESTFSAAGRIWKIRFASERTGVGAPFFVTAATCLVGVTISFLLFALLRLQSGARASAEAIAEHLRRSEAQLQQANRAKDDFLATLSHELRTPMTAILGWSTLLADPLDARTFATAVDAIQKSGRAQAQLIDDLLDVSRITAGKMRIDPRSLDLGPLVNAAVEAIGPSASAKGLVIEKSITNTPLLVNGDPSRMQQVVWNLLTNAVKFTPGGGSVSVSLRERQDAAEIAVSDTGQGIDPSFLPHVFERFRQADSSTTRSYTGLGLGLAIVHHLVELHGGSVRGESEGIGHGARFVVRLPLLRAMPPRGDAAGASGVERVADGLRGARLIFVDDEESVRNFLGAVFRMSNAEVRTARSAREALDLLERAPADIVITDIGMPEMDGYELLRRIRSSPDGRISNVLVIALTAYARPEDRELIEQAGFDGFVAKPVEPGPLRTAVEDMFMTGRRGV